MKTRITSAATLLTFSALTAASVLAASKDTFVNAYGEPVGFADHSYDVVIPNSKDLNRSISRPGSNGEYVWSGTVDQRNYESLGSRQARVEAETRGNVIIGPLEILDSGPTGPMAPEAISAARDDVTAKVLTRINATDHTMASLKNQSKTLDEATQARFDAAAKDVAERRQALREDLKTVRASDTAEWSSARSAVAVSFNAYVQSLHRAEGVVSASQNS